MDEMLSHATEMLLHVVLPSLVIASVVMAVVLLLGGGASAATALALAAALGFGLWWRGLTSLVPGDHAWNRLPWLALAALWIGRVARLQPAGWTLRGAMAIATAWLFLPATVRTEFDWLAPVFAATVFVLWMLLERLAEESPGAAVPVLLALVFFTAGGVLIHAAIKSYFDVAVMLACALIGIALVAGWRRVDAAGAMPAVAVLLPGLLVLGQRNSTVESLVWYVYALPVFAPLLLAETLPIKNWPPVRLFFLRLVVVLVPLVVTMVFAHLQAPLEMVESPEQW